MESKGIFSDTCILSEMHILKQIILEGEKYFLTNGERDADAMQG